MLSYTAIRCKMTHFFNILPVTLSPLQLEKGVDGLYDSFARLDSRISSVGQTAAKIGDHLQVKCLSCHVFWFIVLI